MFFLYTKTDIANNIEINKLIFELHGSKSNEAPFINIQDVLQLLIYNFVVLLITNLVDTYKRNYICGCLEDQYVLLDTFQHL